MSLDKLLRSKETEMTRAVKERKSKIIATMEARGDEEAMFKVNEVIAEYAGRMKGKYPEQWQRVESFHALIGSGLPHGMKTERDFPERKDSVAVFLDDLGKELLDQK